MRHLSVRSWGQEGGALRSGLVLTHKRPCRIPSITITWVYKSKSLLNLGRALIWWMLVPWSWASMLRKPWTIHCFIHSHDSRSCSEILREDYMRATRSHLASVRLNISNTPSGLSNTSRSRFAKQHPALDLHFNTKELVVLYSPLIFFMNVNISIHKCKTEAHFPQSPLIDLRLHF